MSNRLQVLLSDEELADLKSAAADEGVTVSEWVRRSLRESGRRARSDKRDQILAALDRAHQYSFPAPDIGQMLAEIEQGYLE